MKLRKLLSLTLISILALTGCSTQSGDSKSIKKETLTNEQIIEKIDQASKNLKSTKADMQMKQNIKIKDQVIDSNSKISMELIQEPLKIHMNMDITVPQGPSVKTEMYIVDGGMYMKSDQTQGKFQKMDLQGSGIDFNGLKDLINNKEQTNYMKKLADKMTIEDKGAEYEISYSGDGKEILDIIKNNPSLSNNPMLNSENINIKKYNLKSVYDKETLLLKTSVTEMVISAKTPEGEMEMLQNIDLKITENNSINDIVLPEGVK